MSKDTEVLNLQGVCDLVMPVHLYSIPSSAFVFDHGGRYGQFFLIELLDSVGVGYLSRLHGWEDEKQWEAVLSLGEQQRIGMARLFFHRWVTY